MGVRLTTRDPNASFPSGDVAGSVAFAWALMRGCNMPITAVCVVCLALFGRMYWRAHHFFDVVTGASIAAVCCYCVQHFVADVHSVQWWLPVLAHVALMGKMAKAHKAVKHS